MGTKEKYTFSGHESFFCKALWLKKGYDFVSSEHDFNNANAVVDLGVGKNMVASIRFWMRSFGLLSDNNTTDIAKTILNSENGLDPYIEDLGTIWLLHYLLVTTNYATIYNLFFRYFRRERNGEFTKDQHFLYDQNRIA